MQSRIIALTASDSDSADRDCRTGPPGSESRAPPSLIMGAGGAVQVAGGPAPELLPQAGRAELLQVPEYKADSELESEEEKNFRVCHKAPNEISTA